MVLATGEALMTRKQELLTRLKRIEGQVRGLQRMIEEERDCQSLLQQLLAARRALDKVGTLAITNRLSECLGLDKGSRKVDQERLREAIALFEQLA
jgi:DNA-binding FrmR family transcriptional regulator